MKKINGKRLLKDIYTRTYHGSLALFSVLFLILLYRTTVCSQTGSDGLSDENISHFAETAAVDFVADSTDIDIQKNLINDLTVSKNLININNASAEELAELKGIGKKTAENIINYRNENGGFRSVDELINVKGIGKAKMSAIRDLIDI